MTDGPHFNGSRMDRFIAAASVPSQNEAVLDALWASTRCDLRHSIPFAVRHGVALPFIDNLRTLAPRHPEIDQFLRLGGRETILKEAVADFLRWEGESAATVRKLKHGLGFEPIVLKGGATRYSLYPQPWYRPCCDLDLLVPAHQLAPAIELLAEDGFEELSIDPTRKWSARHGHHATVRKGTFLTELHVALDNLRRPRLDYHYFAQNAAHDIFHGDALRPANSSVLLMEAVHFLKHGLDVPLKNLVDMHLAAISGDIDWELLARQADCEGLSPLLHFLLDGCVQLFFSPIPREVLRLFEPGPLRRMLGNSLANPGREGLFIPPLSRIPSVRKLTAHIFLSDLPGGTVKLVSGYLYRRVNDLRQRAKERTSEPWSNQTG